MNQATDVNVVPSYGQRGELHFSQYDVGRVATINLYGVNEAYTIPVSSTVKIQATKPSGLGFDVACSYSGSVVTVTSTATMTAEAGRFPCEIKITKDSDIIGTANIMFVVEPSPHPDDIVDGDAGQVVNQIKALVLEAEGYSLGTQNGTPVTTGSVYYENNAKWYSENAVLSDEVKQNLLECFRNVAWIGNTGQAYYDALANALNRGAELVSISAVYTQGGIVIATDSLDSLKSDLVVTATYDDSSTETVLAYTLSGTLTVGTSTITVSYGGQTTTFNVTVSTGWRYDPANGLLRDQDFVDNFTLGSLSYTEIDSDDHLNFNIPANSGINLHQQYAFIPATASSKATLRIEIKINSISGYSTSDTSNLGWVSFRLSDGTGGANFGFARYGSNTDTLYLRTMVGSTVAPQTASVTLGEYHTIEATIENSKQTIKFDGVTVVNNANFATSYTTANKMFLWGVKSDGVATNFDIKSIEYYEE